MIDMATTRRRLLSLCLQGYPLPVIAGYMRIPLLTAEEALDMIVLGGHGAIQRRLRKRVVEWSLANPGRSLDGAEAQLGLPAQNVAWLLALEGRNHHAPADAPAPDATDPWEEALTQMLGPDVAGLARPLAMARALALGATLDEIGQQYGLTRERVRQIINEQTPWPVPWIREHRNRATEQLRRAEDAAVQAWSLANVGVSIEQAVEDLGLGADRIRSALGKRRGMHEVAAPRVVKRTSDEEILGFLRQFHEETGSTTSASYSLWAREHGAPSHQTVAIRFGAWNTGLQLAGISDAKPIQRDSRFTDEDLWAAFIEATRTHGEGTLTAQDLETWLSSVDGAPSSALIRVRLGLTFLEMLAVALEVISGRSTRGPGWLADVLSPRQWADFVDPNLPAGDFVRRAIADLGPKLTVKEYATWASANGAPSLHTILTRSKKTWNELVAEAGGVPTTARRKARSERELRLWLTAYFDHDPAGTQRGYVEWAKGAGAPSVGVVTAKFGGWQQAKAAVQPPVPTLIEVREPSEA